MYGWNKISVFNFTIRLWHRQSVVSIRMVSPAQVAEINRVTAHAVGLHRNPDVRGQIQAGFHYNQSTFGLRDVEAENIGLYAKAPVVS